MKISRKLKMTEIVGLVLVCTLIFLLFFPVYPQRGVSKRSWCYSNLKQLAFAYLMYAEDGDGYAPPYVPQPQLVRAADAVEFVQVPAQPDAWMNCLQEFVRSDGIYRCPLDPHFGKPDQLEGRYGACTHERTS
ncbi:MAG: hypothetical protein SFX74_01525, partial [Fimbriimonadaceae bacterium]|nr:hypothetical protein [Fimbriimonadaceae bacterium]